MTLIKIAQLLRELHKKNDPIAMLAATGLDIAPGTPSGNGITRARRAALGNCLDPRLAAMPAAGGAIALRRVLYLNSLIF